MLTTVDVQQMRMHKEVDEGTSAEHSHRHDVLLARRSTHDRVGLIIPSVAHRVGHTVFDTVSVNADTTTFPAC